jgi:hypothetical protein
VIWLLLLACAKEPEVEGMRKTDFVPPTFEPAVALDDPAFAHWLAGTDAEIKLPITIWRGPIGQIEAAAIGAPAARPEVGLRLDDAALGISLVDRARDLCGETDPCTIWLSGRYSPERFSVLAVHGLAGPGPWTAERAVAR